MPCFHASNNIPRIKARRKTTLHACCCKFCHRRQASHSLPPDEKPVSVTVIAVLGTASSLHLGGRLRACRPLETPRCSRKLSSLGLVCPGHRPPQPPRGAGGRGRAGGAAVRLRARAAWNRSSLTRKVTPPGCGGGGDVPRDSLAGTSPTTIAIDTDPDAGPLPGGARPTSAGTALTETTGPAQRSRPPCRNRPPQDEGAGADGRSD